MPFKPEDLRKAAIALTLGGIAGAAIVQSHHDEAKKSRAEKDDPEGTEWICDIVWDLLDDWEPPDMECEDDYTDHLFRYLRRAIGDVLEEDDPDVSLEMRTGTLHGIPDILIHDRLVLELKVSSKKSERDRLVVTFRIIWPSSFGAIWHTLEVWTHWLGCPMKRGNSHWSGFIFSSHTWNSISH